MGRTVTRTMRDGTPVRVTFVGKPGKTQRKCPGCKRLLHRHETGMVTCINSRCKYYSPGK